MERRRKYTLNMFDGEALLGATSYPDETTTRVTPFFVYPPTLDKQWNDPLLAELELFVKMANIGALTEKSHASDTQAVS